MSRLMNIVRPLAFDIFQFLIGGTIAKRKLVMEKYPNSKRVLEVGCATGNVAAGFLHHDVDYTGLDIDGPAIDYATRKFRHKKNFSFVCNRLQEQAFKNDFDFIIFSGILHHVDDATATNMLEFSRTILAPEGHVVISDPIQPGCGSSTLIKLFRKIERGKYVRTFEELSGLLARLRGLRVAQKDCRGVGPFPIGSVPIVANFAVFLLSPCNSDDRF